ncbi:MAG: Gfo/Idh/MocA family oxidoreductase, partial [Clostridia bacterium]|nr:Gfo/Idh/MocA family oxidoreductase [Clostridia bacterium]
PPIHYTICKQALLSGKHVYVEKPLCLKYSEGKELVLLAKEKGLYLGCAPDTFLGAGIQTCKNVIDNGKIGKPIGGVAYMMCRGHETWHPSPEFYYQNGGGPLFDMGPYYITALVSMLGKVESVMAYAHKGFEERIITSQPKYGKKITVEVDTHTVALLKFANGATITMTMSFDVLTHTLPNIELYGTLGSIKVPDPNNFGGSVMLSTLTNKDYTEIPLITPYYENSRGIGLTDTIKAIEENRQNCASGELALHVLEVMESIDKSASLGVRVNITSTPPTLPNLDWSAPLGEIKTL